MTADTPTNTPLFQAQFERTKAALDKRRITRERFEALIRRKFPDNDTSKVMAIHYQECPYDY